jgi:hypothetical protein
VARRTLLVYVWNQPALSLVENMNRALEISTGQWVMQLDDDYLLPGGRGHAGGDGVRRREQTFRREQYLEPREALRRLLRNSSFVREPTAVVRRAAMEREGLFDTTVGGATDTDMWVRLFSRYGVRCLLQATCAYTIHEAAATTGMWNPDTIRANGEIFDRAVAREALRLFELPDVAEVATGAGGVHGRHGRGRPRAG